MSLKPKRVLLGDVAISKGIKTGPFGSQLKAEEYTNEGIPVVMPKDIQSGYLTETSIARISKTKANSKWKQIRTKSLFKERKETKRGDLPLLSITNGEGVIPREDTNRKDTSNKDKSKYLRICPGDIGYNTMRMWQGVSALSSLEGIVSPAYTICIPGEKLHPLFVSPIYSRCHS